MVRSKPCANPHDSSDLQRFLPEGLTPYVLNNYTTKSFPLPRHRGRRYRAHRALGGRENHQPSLRTRPGRSHRRSLRNPLGRAFSNHHGNERRTSSTPGNTSSNTGPEKYCNVNRQIGCIDACASVLPSENSHETRAPDFFVSRRQPRRAPRLDTSLQQYHPSRRHPLLVQGPRSSLVAQQDPRPHQNGRPLRRPLLGRPRTSQAQAPSFSAHYSYWSGTRLVVASNSSRKTPSAGNFAQRRRVPWSLTYRSHRDYLALLVLMTGSRLLLVVTSQVICVLWGGFLSFFWVQGCAAPTTHLAISCIFMLETWYVRRLRNSSTCLLYTSPSPRD